MEPIQLIPHGGVHWAKKGKEYRVPARYERKGTYNLFGIKDLKTGEIFGEVYERKTFSLKIFLLCFE